MLLSKAEARPLVDHEGGAGEPTPLIGHEGLSKMNTKTFFGGVALTALSIAMSSGQAFAQSTASQIQEDEIVITAAGRRSIEGLITAEQGAKARATITQDYIEQQAPGQSILNTINLVPGVNFTNSDAYGSSGGNLNIRGFDGNRVSLTFDGIPLNDTGNYAIYSNQQLDPELITRANVNLGTTDVDSPTASATGGTVNYVTRTPTDDFGVQASFAVGSESFERIFVMVDTGALTSSGLRAFGSASRQNYDQFTGPGDLQKQQYNFRIYQPLGADGDFISLSYHYNENRNAFYNSFTMAQYNAGVLPVYDAHCFVPPGTTGVADPADSCANFYGTRINPSNTGNVRVQSLFSLSDRLTLTVDPSFQYVRANGGGASTFSETAAQLIANTPAAGIDLNGDGDFLDTVRLYSPSNTNTRRYGVTSSLIWDITDDQTIRVGFTYDYGRHRQTGEFGYLSPIGTPENVFGGKDGFGTQILNGAGEVFNKRNRYSVASLQQWSAEYRGDFMNDMFTLVAGVRAPEFERELNQFCYARKGSTSSTQYCTNETPIPSPSSPGFFRFGASTQDYAPPFTATVQYDDILPNLGLTFRPAEGHQLFFSYAEGLSAPRTDDLYGGILASQLATVEPETSQAYDIGYRFQSGPLMLAATAWYNKFQNRLVYSEDPLDPSVRYSRNVGDVNLWGGDFAIGYAPTDALTLYGSLAYTMSELQENLPGQTQGEGNQLVDTPEWTANARVEYDFGPLVAGLTARYIGERFTNDFNTEKTPDATVADLDLRWEFGDSFGRPETYLQLNVINLFDERYIGDIAFSGANGGLASFRLGAPQTILLSLNSRF